MLISLKIFFEKILTLGKQIIVRKTSTTMFLLISTFSALILYKLFFAFSKIIWSKNLKIDPSNLSPQIRSWVLQCDGIETYILYSLVFACIFLTILLVSLFDYLKLLHKSILLIFLSLTFILSTLNYVFKIGFNPPMSNRLSGLTPFLIMAIIVFAVNLLVKVSYKKEKVANLLIVISLIPICFVATSPISMIDYSYIFAPALRLLNGFEIKEIYFQYDLLLSFIAAIWMKLNIDLNFFQIVGQFSFYILFLASFFFSKKFFITKQLAYYLLFSLVLVKIYGLMYDTVLVFQVTPLRLDWWLLLLIISFNRGIYNKLLGIALGLLIIFHRTFGLIYAIGYFEIIFVLFLLDLMSDRLSFQYFLLKIKKHFFLCLPNISTLVLSFILSLLILGDSLEAASIYQKIGIGFLPISAVSFYWYFPILVSTTVIFLIKRRKKLSINYFNSSLFLIFLSIGNSIYFFGRSHEHNIINVSASLIFVLFLFFDLAIYQGTHKTGLKFKREQILSVLLPSSFVLLLVFFYSAGIVSKSQIQFRNLLKHETIYPITTNWKIGKLRELTNNSNKIYFAGAYDFYYYYHGNYTPEGHFSPYLSWVYKKDMINFMQNLLSKGYYIVFSEQELGKDSEPQNELLSELRFNKIITQDGFKVIWNNE